MKQMLFKKKAKYFNYDTSRNISCLYIKTNFIKWEEKTT